MANILLLILCSPR